ncbi:Glyoxylate reductase/hydroxypyruvate reductase [Smittium culicis]|uniref:Glyoxylate reductase/hydroxypyruvate reductase n=1 Tax=Smittium culicis TaxID=133412 RepID=A0A1R1Y832_9FUNG|nr:Glyoxylate reductase/hydroxypyruvate reductase [Smittium culicis]OMJ22994.1 Glyoxylate reductase/hydroxypyruvate reductase [Smittium culicis]
MDPAAAKLASLFDSVANEATGILVLTTILPPKTQQLFDEFKKRVNQNLTVRQWTNVVKPTKEELFELIKGANSILSTLKENVNEEFINAAGPQLKTISIMGTGYDHINLDVVNKYGIKLGFTPGAVTSCTADITLLLILGAIRRAKEGINAVSEGLWGPWDPNWLLGYEFGGKTIGIIGLGRIGCAVASRVIPLGISKILYTSRSVQTEKEEGLLRISKASRQLENLHAGFATKVDESGFSVERKELDELLRLSDIVVVTCALNKETYHLINEEKLMLMKPTAVLVNSARGGIVDGFALAKALENDTIFAAGLDVTDPEPIPMTHPLVSHPRCMILPHLGFATSETHNRTATFALLNVLSGALGKDLPFRVI